MQGLALCEKYYQAFGRNMLEQSFPGKLDRIAVGLVGKGSECLGFDDGLSRDHDWGPGFCLWLDREDYRGFGQELQQGYDGLPATYLGLQRKNSDWGNGRLGVQETGNFYKSFLGIARAPENDLEWLVTPQTNLAACTSGKVFSDPIGEFSAIRERLLAYYPGEVRLKKIAARCMSAGQSGQYNYQRCLQRKDDYGAAHALIRFCEDIFTLVFLLNRRYMPYFKWHRRAAQDLPILGKVMAGEISALLSAREPGKRLDHIQTICKKTCNELRQQGLSRTRANFLVDHGPQIHGQIESPDLRQLDVWYGGG